MSGFRHRFFVCALSAICSFIARVTHSIKSLDEQKGTVATIAPTIFRFTDIDAFRSSVRNLNVDFTPLAREISAEQIILNLPGCCVNYTKSFPRIIDAQLDPDCTAVGFTMDDGFPIRFNGVEEDRSAVVIGSGGAFYSQIERTPRQYASIFFTSGTEDRGWPRTGPNFEVFETSPYAHHVLRSLIVQVTSVAYEPVEAVDLTAVSGAIRESLLTAVDTAFAAAANALSPSPNSVRQFRIVRDIQALLSEDMAHPVYSGDLAKHLGVSVRTMHDAVKRYRGMSLHRYLRLRRLWLVRKRLIEGSQSVKACALALGFWHLGDFSRSYFSQFGEMPSETLARSSRRGTA
jgi:AraC-like DNA-binding protein